MIELLPLKLYSFSRSMAQKGQNKANLFRVPEYVGKNKRYNFPYEEGRYCIRHFAF